MSECLTIEDIKTVQSLLWKERVKWYNIGIQLDLQAQLEAIKRNFDTVEDRFTQMLLEWLRQDKPKPTWKALISALRSTPVDCKKIAADIEERFIPTSPNGQVPCNFPGPSPGSRPGFSPSPSPSLSPDFSPDGFENETSLKVQDLDQKFSELVTKTHDVLVQEKKMTLSFLRSRFASFPSTRRHEHQEFLDTYIFEIGQSLTADGLWLKLCKYWHFLNYHLLKFIIDAIGNDLLVTDMKKYAKKMEQFSQETSLLNFVKCFPDLYRQGIPKDCQKLEVKISSKHSELKLVHLNCLSGACVTTFAIPKICGFILKSVALGCFLITWLVPAHYCQLLRWKLSICHEKFFEDHDIQSVTLEKEVCYKKGSQRAPINPAHEVASHTTITEEVFELRNMMMEVTKSSPPFTMTQLCTAYVYKILSQYLSSQGKEIILKSLTKLPQEVRKKFSRLCKEAYKRTTQSLDAIGTFSLSKDGLGFTSCTQGSHQVFLHRTLQQYLAALYVVSANSSRVLEVMTARVEQAQHSYLYYFIAGLASDKKWIHETLLKSFQHHLNRYILLFEVGNPLITSQIMQQVESINAQTQSSLLTTVQNLITNTVPSLQSLADFKFTEWDAFLRDDLQSRAVAVNYTMHIVGCLLYFSSSVWQLQNHWDLPILEGITRGMIAASENTCKCEEEFPHEDLKVNIVEVSSSTSDMEYFLKMPFCILEKIQTLRLASNAFQDLIPTSDSSLLSECATFVAELFNRGYHIEEFELNTKCFDSDSLDTIISGLQQSKHLRSLKFCGDLTVDHLIGLSECLKTDDSTIVELQFDQCGLEEEGTFELAKMLMENTLLKVLSITGENNAIGSGSVCAIAKALQVNEQLKTLDLRAVRLSSEGASSVGKMLSVNQSLETLCLDHTDLDSEGAVWLVDGLASNKTLRELELYHCGTSDIFDSDPLVNALKGGNVVISSRVSFNSQQ